MRTETSRTTRTQKTQSKRAKSGKSSANTQADLASEKAGGDPVMTMFFEGFMPAEIAQSLGASEASIRTTIGRTGKNPNRYSYDDGTAAEWAEYYSDLEEPWSVSAIAEAWNVSPGLVNAALLRRGVRIRHASLSVSLAARYRKRRKNAH